MEVTVVRSRKKGDKEKKKQTNKSVKRAKKQGIDRE